MIMSSFLYAFIYFPKVNRILRNVSYLFASLLPEKFKIHPSGKLKVKIDNKRVIYFKTNQTSYVTRELFWKKSKNYEYTPVFTGLIKKTDCFFDIGSSIGYYSLLGVAVNPGLSVHSFEPSPGAAAYLSENVKINGFSQNICVHPVALSDKAGITDFYEVYNKKYPGVSNLSGEHNIGTKLHLKANKIRIQTDTLDNFVTANGIENIGLIKLDTEGCEDLILRSASETIKKFRPIIICETLFNRIEGSLENTMKLHDYLFFNFNDNQLIKVDSIKRNKDNGVRNCFFVPKEKEFLMADYL